MKLQKYQGYYMQMTLQIFADSDDNLNKTFDVVNEWCKDCDLKVNAEKCNVFHFRKKIKDINKPDVFSKLENKQSGQHNHTNILGWY